ncbi:MAG: C40 family peptidase [Mucilaginibacter polytrichastri]|nr:C40 family peptidase [Mucilaginibacter polytrichastri]
MKKTVLVVLISIAASFSASAQVAKITPNISTQATTEDSENLVSKYFSQIMGVALSATSNVKLFQTIYDWIGTPYRLGGDTKRGIDCSGFAHEVYDKVFNTSIANNSRNIFSMVNPIPKDDLKEGDLVFFKIHSRSITHVGVYLGDGRFAHASSSKGVMISNLSSAYWQRYYYKGGRLLESTAAQTDGEE